MYVYCSTLYHDDGTALATFSSHWAACAAMIRRSIRLAHWITGVPMPLDVAAAVRGRVEQ